MRQCLVTGATGFLGTNLVHELVKEGWKVRAFFDSSKAVRGLDYVIPPLTKMLDDAYYWYRENGFLN